MPEPDSERGDVRVADLSVEPGDVSEYELAVVARAHLVGPRGEFEIERHYEGLPRQNDTVERDAVDTNDGLLDDPAAVHVHTKFFGGAGGDEADGDYLGDEHARWKPTDPSVLADSTSFESACRAHFEETASATYERGADAR